ncbi:MAG: cupin domain-containing protein [Chitinophagaceae bacterium]
MITATQWVEKLGLLPHPEGGYYKETYRSNAIIAKGHTLYNSNGDRNLQTAIYFLIEDGNFSAFHRIAGDEIWHFYYGNTLLIHEITKDGELITTQLGNNLLDGDVLQYTIKAGNWFASEVKSGGSYTLVGCTVAPGFDFNDFELAEKKLLCAAYPFASELIARLCRQ